jgi:hypothetical protein
VETQIGKAQNNGHFANHVHRVHGDIRPSADDAASNALWHLLPLHCQQRKQQRRATAPDLGFCYIGRRRRQTLPVMPKAAVPGWWDLLGHFV